MLGGARVRGGEARDWWDATGKGAIHKSGLGVETCAAGGTCAQGRGERGYAGGEGVQ